MLPILAVFAAEGFRYSRTLLCHLVRQRCDNKPAARTRSLQHLEMTRCSDIPGADVAAKVQQHPRRWAFFGGHERASKLSQDVHICAKGTPKPHVGTLNGSDFCVPVGQPQQEGCRWHRVSHCVSRRGHTGLLQASLPCTNLDNLGCIFYPLLARVCRSVM